MTTLTLVAPTTPAESALPAVLEPVAPIVRQLEIVRAQLEQPELDVTQLLGIHDRVVVVQALAREVDAAFEVAHEAAVVRLRSERRIGAALEQIISSHPTWAATPGSKRSRHQAATATRLYLPRGLRQQLGFSGSQASRWRMLARVPTDVFEQQLDAARLERREVSTTGLVRLARQLDVGRTRAGQPKLSTRTKLRRILAYMRDIRLIGSAQERQLLRSILDIATSWQRTVERERLTRPDLISRSTSCMLCAQPRPASMPAKCSCGGRWLLS